jgi:hypothetical protein
MKKNLSVLTGAISLLISTAVFALPNNDPLDTKLQQIVDNYLHSIPQFL